MLKFFPRQILFLSFCLLLTQFDVKAEGEDEEPSTESEATTETEEAIEVETVNEVEVNLDESEPDPQIVEDQPVDKEPQEAEDVVVDAPVDEEPQEAEEEETEPAVEETPQNAETGVEEVPQEVDNEEIEPVQNAEVDPGIEGQSQEETAVETAVESEGTTKEEEPQEADNKESLLAVRQVEVEEAEPAVAEEPGEEGPIAADETGEIIDLNIDEGTYTAPVNMAPLGQFRNRNYYYSDGFRVNYFQADQICKDLDMALVSVTSKEQNDFLFRNIEKIGKYERFWTTGSNFLTGKSWIWMTTGESTRYTNWIPGEPTEMNKNCIELVWLKGDNLKWNNEDCNEKLSFICEYGGIVLHPRQTGLTSILGVLQGPISSVGFNYNRKSYYAVNNLALTYFDASRACRILGLELVSILSEEENVQIYHHLRNSMSGTNFWSGGTRIVDGTNWNWLSSGQTITYTRWQEGQPDNDEDKCLLLVFHPDGLDWDDLNCETQQNFICETTQNSFSVSGRKPKEVENINKNIIQLTPSAIKIKIIAPSERKSNGWMSRFTSGTN